MKLPRRKILHLAAGAAAIPAVSRFAWAQGYPTKPVRWIVPFPPGGGTDIVARLIGQWLSERLGQPFIIENRPGAGTNIGTEAVVRAPADGYTLLLVASVHAINATLYDKLSFNFIRDIAPVASIIRQPLIMLVNPSLPVKTVREFIAYVIMAGIDMVHVPYRGTAPALTDLLGGQVQVYFATPGPSIEYVKVGKLRALAVTTAARSETLPDLPTVGDFLPGFEASLVYGLGAPKNTPAEVVDRLNREINAALADSKIKARLGDMDGMVLALSPAEFGRLLAGETEKWGKVIRAANIKAE